MDACEKFIYIYIYIWQCKRIEFFKCAGKKNLYYYKICHKSTFDFFLFILFQVIVSVLKPKKSTLFISEDEGETFESCPLSFTPHVVSCSPASDKLIVAHDQDANKVCGGKLSFLMIIFIRKFVLTDS